LKLAADLQISRVLTGLGQIAHLERDGKTLDPVVTARFMRPYVEAGFTTFDMAGHHGSSEIIAGHFNHSESAGSEVQLLTKWVPRPGWIPCSGCRN
jgi:aryl-alcohol dehydrogenase-like predicted oxidoreductase